MYQIDFLPVESENGLGTKSGDAIAAQFTLADGRTAVIVIDGGYGTTGESIVEHIDTYYGTRYVDIVISTHPDADHINGLKHVIETLEVGELLVHRPRKHALNIDDFSNLEAVDNLISAAETRGVTVSEPFAGIQRWDGQLRILGPTQDYYRELLQQHLQEVKSGVAARRRSLAASLMTKGRDLLAWALPALPIETLGDDGETGPRNNTSAIVLLAVDDHRILFTGDAGIPALSAAADQYEIAIGPLDAHPLAVLQAPHHGSRHNLAPSLLNRLVGAPGTRASVFQAPISSAKASPKHPSPKVVNALTRRGGYVVATEGKTVCVQNQASRPGWTTVPAIPPLHEADD